MPDPVAVQRIAERPLEELAGCHECDLLMERPRLAVGETAKCPRCGFELFSRRHNVASRSLALVLAALLLYVPANFLPIMHLELLGQTSYDTVWTGVLGLFNSDMQGIAIVVFLCSMAIPLIKLLCQLMVLTTIQLNRGRRLGVQLYRFYHHLRDWGMLEVYLMGVLVAVVKLADMAELRLGLGLACFIGLLVVQICLEIIMSPHQIWAALSGEDDHARH
jgi:paraquat-inducible protein A